MTGKWGSVPRCPACDKSVYPVEQVFAADRKPFHRGCINCQVRQNFEQENIFIVAILMCIRCEAATTR